ncbi:putative C-type lectin domain family 20 member A [Sphaeramia orbicularis]|uniref:putative C-type lectin domain family 20 member A n=1 Tax=Sphaeramia orbicularis TaxID=375764 RepID=UPI00117F613B|nr:putative C-type lectin domain family 20 member A [Sphaeramia orbicularis]
MERILLAVLCLSVWSISTCLLHQYHYVHELKTWTEAQSYCRRHYTDLATIENSSEVDQLINAVSDKSVSEVWIGLFSEVDWRWSDGYTGNESGYRRWCAGWSEPNFWAADQFCVFYCSSGWWDYGCEEGLPFICFSGTQFVYINQSLSWTAAQSYCRSNYVDLATVKNPSDDQMIQNVTPSDSSAWIGLFRNPNFNWPDGSSFSFTYWYDDFNPLNSLKIICGVAYLKNSGKWRFVPCDNRRPFVCHGTPSVVKKQTVKLRMKVEDSSVDLNDPVIRADILKKLQEKLNMTGVTLKWGEQPDGKVFHKMKEHRQKKNKKKTEL